MHLASVCSLRSVCSPCILQDIPTIESQDVPIYIHINHPCSLLSKAEWDDVGIVQTCCWLDTGGLETDECIWVLVDVTSFKEVYRWKVPHYAFHFQACMHLLMFLSGRTLSFNVLFCLQISSLPPPTYTSPFPCTQLLASLC
jgi:hypothetical protein